MITAEAHFYPSGIQNRKNGIQGVVSFSQSNSNFVRVDISLKNVPPGSHGIHVHEKAVKCLKNTEDCCKSAGGHFNGPLNKWSRKYPSGTPHGSWAYRTDRHIGDLCNNIIADSLGNVEFSYLDNLISLVPDHPHNIVGRSIIIHEAEDDCGLARLYPFSGHFNTIEDVVESKITGNAGSRIACANIVRYLE